MYSNGQLDFSDSAALAAYRNARLAESLQHAANHSAFYRKLFGSAGVDPAKIRSTDDLKLIPPTTKRDLQLFNSDFFCVPPKRIAEYTSTSGTLGAPVVVPLSENDLQRLAFNEYLSFVKMGLSDEDVLQLVLTLDKQFMAGMAYYHGARRIGAATVRSGPGVPAMQWDTVFRLGTTALAAVPSFVVKLLDYADANGINYAGSKVKRILCIGENIRGADLSLNLIGQKIVSRWNVALHSTYASTEMQTAFTECSAGAGGHVHPELLFAEILDDSDNPLPDGETGELAVTLFGVEAMPLIRYRTGDLCRIVSEPCKCGRTVSRISPIVGRKGQMVKLKGTTLYPPAIFEILNGCEEIEDYAVEVSTGELGTDALTVYLALKPDGSLAAAESHLRSALRVRPEVKACPLAELRDMQCSEASRKTSRFIDRRTQ
ncbi:MAG: AMP-binding protein [Prevotellaceae bacterium]|jgi:phenylacetate-CoA ligase|nr:AMP-binding protein [Prevotellaceae bacterium]